MNYDLFDEWYQEYRKEKKLDDNYSFSQEDIYNAAMSAWEKREELIKQNIEKALFDGIQDKR